MIIFSFLLELNQITLTMYILFSTGNHVKINELFSKLSFIDYIVHISPFYYYNFLIQPEITYTNDTIFQTCFFPKTVAEKAKPLEIKILNETDT